MMQLLWESPLELQVYDSVYIEFELLQHLCDGSHWRACLCYQEHQRISDVLSHSVEVCILQSRCCSISEAVQWMRFYKKPNAVESFFERETWHSVCVPDVMRGVLDRKECVCLGVYLSCALFLNFLISPASPVYIAASVHTASLSLCLHPCALFQSLPCFPRL